MHSITYLLHVTHHHHTTTTTTTIAITTTTTITITPPPPSSLSPQQPQPPSHHHHQHRYHHHNHHQTTTTTTITPPPTTSLSPPPQPPYTSITFDDFASFDVNTLTVYTKFCIMHCDDNLVWAELNQFWSGDSQVQASLAGPLKGTRMRRPGRNGPEFIS